jgi:ElaB/YqjD/DUF883 family membrane-anchored ribosome-binding protein
MTMPNSAAAPPAGSAGSEAGEESRTGGAREQIREVKNQVVDQAKTSFRQARDSATSSLTDSRHQAAERIGGIASAVRSTSDHLRAENQPGVANLADSLAQQVERLSTYLREGDLRRFRDDAEAFARRQPAVAIGVSLALGMLGARFFKSSRRPSDSSRESSRGGDYEFESGRPAYGVSSQPAGGGYGGA